MNDAIDTLIDRPCGSVAVNFVQDLRAEAL